MLELIKQFNAENDIPLGLWLEENINHVEDLERSQLLDVEDMKIFLTNLKIQVILD